MSNKPALRVLDGGLATRSTGSEESKPRRRGRPPTAKRFSRDRIIDGMSRSELALRYNAKVTYIARRFARRLPPGCSVELGDLMNTGYVGLMDAIDKYDPEQNVALGTFVEYRIQGAILDHLRGLDTISRHLRQKANAVQRVQSTLSSTHGREPTVAEMAEGLHLSIPEYNQLRTRIRPVNCVSLDSPKGVADESRLALVELLSEEDAVAPDTAYEDKQSLEMMWATMDQVLPSRERQVLEGYYLDSLSLKEIGASLGVTESRVSQLHSKALLRLRFALGQQLRPGVNFDELMARRRSRRGRPARKHVAA